MSKNENHKNPPPGYFYLETFPCDCDEENSCGVSYDFYLSDDLKHFKKTDDHGDIESWALDFDHQYYRDNRFGIKDAIDKYINEYNDPSISPNSIRK